MVLASSVLVLTVGIRLFAADLIVFKDGTSVECEVVKETEGRVVYLVKGRERVAARSSILRIEHTEAKTVDFHGRLTGNASERETSGTRIQDISGGDKGQKGDREFDTPSGLRYEGGYAPGLVAHYYKDADNWNGLWQEGVAPQVPAKEQTFTKYAYSTVEPHVNHVFIRRGWFTIRWAGTLVVGNPAGVEGKKANESDLDPEIKFEFHADDGARLTINGRTLIDDWNPRSEETEASHRFASMALRPGKHQIVIEYFQGESLMHDDNDPAKLYWSSKDLRIPRQLIPASHFMHTMADLQPKPGRDDEESVKLNFVPPGKGAHNNEDWNNKNAEDEKDKDSADTGKGLENKSDDQEGKGQKEDYKNTGQEHGKKVNLDHENGKGGGNAKAGERESRKGNAGGKKNCR
jgi:RNase P/RNase MRP subunit p29